MSRPTIICNPVAEDDDSRPWTKVGSKKRRKKKVKQTCNSLQYPKIKPVKHYWYGFNKQGKERWYIELNNGELITNTNNEYDFWVKRYYPNNTF